MPLTILNRCSMLALLVGMPLLLGCGGGVAGPKTAKATGVVTYKGQPVAGATVTFTASGKSPRTGVGVTDDKGGFILGTFGKDDGATLGDHTVTVTKFPGQVSKTQMKPEDYMKNMSGAPGGNAKPALPGSDIKNELPEKYATTKDSPLKAKVEASGKNEFKFDLTD